MDVTRGRWLSTNLKNDEKFSKSRELYFSLIRQVWNIYNDCNFCCGVLETRIKLNLAAHSWYLAGKMFLRSTRRWPRFKIRHPHINIYLATCKMNRESLPESNEGRLNRPTVTSPAYCQLSARSAPRSTNLPYIRRDITNAPLICVHFSLFLLAMKIP